MTSRGPRVVVVTGASSGIGRETALAFARRGDELVLFARREAGLRQTATACEAMSGQAPLVVVGDVVRQEDLDRLAAECRARFGRIDVLVNNAGRGHRNVPFDELTDPEIDDVIRVNLTGAIRCVRALLPLLRMSPGATLVNVGSVLSRTTLPYYTIYCATKYGLAGFTDSLRFELRGSSVRVMLVNPGHTTTEFFDTANMDPKAFGPVRGVSPDTVASAIVRGVDRGSREIALTGWGRLGIAVNRFAPWLYRAVIGGQAKRGNPPGATANPAPPSATGGR
ncbi:MAG: SDR family NAD(P)-dependent oxidoreductase [Planctomycetes bacterium]|nr:SDR family NAD(P)-dependent oxidoreductase [Planctomycetota bacterium]